MIRPTIKDKGPSDLGSSLLGPFSLAKGVSFLKKMGRFVTLEGNYCLVLGLVDITKE